MRHVTTLRVKIAFSPAKQIPDPRSGGDVSVHRSTVRQEWPRFGLADEAVATPTRCISSMQFIDEPACQAIAKINEETIVLQIFSTKSPARDS